MTGEEMKYRTNERDLPFRVEVFADVVCPWCYVAKRYLQKALEYYAESHAGERQPEVVWRPFLLHAAMPEEGLDRGAYLKRRFPGQLSPGEMLNEVGAAGRKVGVAFRFDLIHRQPNSIDAHRLIWLAQQHGVPVDGLVDSLFAAFFHAGKDISKPEVLEAAAGQTAVPEIVIRRFLHGTEGRDEVLAQDALAKRRGITTVPFLLLNGHKGVSALQQPETLFGALRWARKNSVRPKWWPKFI